MIDDTDCIYLRVRGKGKGCLRSSGMLFLSAIHFCVVECAQGTKTQTFTQTKEPHAQEDGIAPCSPPSKYVRSTM